VNHNHVFRRFEEFCTTSYRNYKTSLRALAQTKDVSYGNPQHEIIGLNGDARFKRIKHDLTGFEDEPIPIQIMMHKAAFSIEGPLIWDEEYAHLPLCLF
jgi:hypothetical protein